MDPYKRPRRTCTHRKRHKAGCDSCRAYARWRYHNRERARNSGEPLTVDAEPVRRYVLDVLKGQHQMTNKQIIARSGVNPSSFSGLLYSVSGRPPSQRLFAATAAALLGVTSPARPAPRATIDATATRRRLQALQYAGHRLTTIADGHPALSRNRLGMVASGRLDRVTHAVADGVAQRCRELAGTPGDCERVARRARRYGWVDLAAWDDHTIGDPAATPDGVAVAEPAPSPTFDEITVAQGVAGELTYAQLARHLPDLVETVRRLAVTTNDLEVAHLLRWPGVGTVGADPRKDRGQDAVSRLRKANGIPPAPRVQAVVPDPYKRPRDRRPAPVAA